MLITARDANVFVEHVTGGELKTHPFLIGVGDNLLVRGDVVCARAPRPALIHKADAPDFGVGVVENVRDETLDDRAAASDIRAPVSGTQAPLAVAEPRGAAPFLKVAEFVQEERLVDEFAGDVARA